MSLRGWLSKQIVDFRGAWTRVDGIEIRPNRGFVSKNVRFEPGRVKTRDGFVVRLATGPVTTMHNWVTSAFNRVVFFEGALFCKILDVATDVVVQLFVQAGRGVVVAEAGDKAFIATFGTDGLGVGPVRISLPTVSTGTIDTAFSAPWTFAPTITDVGAGLVTQGVHQFAYIVETRTGYVGAPSPVSGTTFTPVSFTVTAGGRTLHFAFTANIPVDAVFVHMLMTRVDSPAWYFVPGGAIAVTGGATSFSVSGIINVADERLADSAEEADTQFSALYSNQMGYPSSVVSYGKRMVYVVDTKAYISDPDDYQFITEDQHAVQLPGKRRIITAFPLRQSLYLVGPTWTHAVSDTGDVPVLWAEPTEVSSAIGTPSTLGVEWRTAGDYAWVAAVGGLYMFDGQYAVKPISYYNTPEWNRINWAAAYAVQVRDDYPNQRVYVAAPLDTATNCSHLFVWDYSRGLTPENVDFSLDNFNSAQNAGQFGAMSIVQSATSKKAQLWIAPSPFLGNVWQQDPTALDDAGAHITSLWESGYVLGPSDKRKRYNRFGGVDLAISGRTAAAIQIMGIDRVRTFALPNALTLSVVPGETYEFKFNVMEENISVRVSSADLGGGVPYFDLSGLTVYWKPYVTNK